MTAKVASFLFALLALCGTCVTAASFAQAPASPSGGGKTLIDYFLPMPVVGKLSNGRVGRARRAAARPAQRAGRPDDPEMGLLGRADRQIARRQVSPVCQPVGPLHGAQGVDQFRGGACRQRQRHRPLRGQGDVLARQHGRQRPQRHRPDHARRAVRGDRQRDPAGRSLRVQVAGRPVGVAGDHHREGPAEVARVERDADAPARTGST